jgi:hypothetical protein
MNYTKPEVAVLGQAVRVIEARTAKKSNVNYDGPPFISPKTLNAAYDLDE